MTVFPNIHTRHGTIPQGPGAIVVMDRLPVKPDCQNRFVFGNAPVGLECSIGAGQMVQGHPVPVGSSTANSITGNRLAKTVRGVM